MTAKVDDRDAQVDKIQAFTDAVIDAGKRYAVPPETGTLAFAATVIRLAIERGVTPDQADVAFWALDKTIEETKGECGNATCPIHGEVKYQR